MKHDPAPFDRSDEDAAAIARGREDILAGRVVAHDEVAEWLSRWGNATETAMPLEWLK